MSRKLVRAALLLVAVLGACTPPSAGPTLTPTPELPSGVVTAKSVLSDSQEIPMSQIEVISYESMDWPNGCLGLGEPGEGCVQVITPGYRVVLEADDERYVYRTDTTGEVVRRAE